MEDLSIGEIDFIVESLQQRWLDSVEKLKRKDLGDIERTYYEFVKSTSKELMQKLDI
jgi:hypothetical protein